MGQLFLADALSSMNLFCNFGSNIWLQCQAVKSCKASIHYFSELQHGKKAQWHMITMPPDQSGHTGAKRRHQLCSMQCEHELVCTVWDWDSFLVPTYKSRIDIVSRNRCNLLLYPWIISRTFLYSIFHTFAYFLSSYLLCRQNDSISHHGTGSSSGFLLCVSGALLSQEIVYGLFLLCSGKHNFEDALISNHITLTKR